MGLITLSSHNPVQKTGFDFLAHAHIMSCIVNILFFETTEEEQPILSASVSGADVTFSSEKLTDATVALARDAEVISVFINSKLSKEIIDALPKLKLISTRSTGYDHIDVAYARSKGIAVSNIPSYGSRTVAEFTFALMLDISRKVSAANRQIREEGSFDISHFRGFDLFGKTLGVIGTGRIGKNVIGIARGFGMNVVAFDIFPDERYAAENGFKYLPLADVLRASDIVTIHAPSTEKTRHIINMDTIRQFKKDAYLINTARGDIVDTDALVFGLQKKLLAGAALDVLEGEQELKEDSLLPIMSGANNASDAANRQYFKTLLEDHILMTMPNVIITPHIAFSSREAEAEILKTSAENIVSFMKGSPDNIIPA
jgi:D-lactate dehydrogenase